jgi:GNAT superfamily N-acetyltransferase
MPLVIATRADSDDIVALVESAFRGDASRAGWTTEADLLDGRRTGPDEIGAILSDPEQRVLLDRDSHGALRASVVVSRDGNTAWFGMLAVVPALQGAGTGRRVLSEVEHWVASNWGTRRMRMKVIAQRSELIAWYERRGYRRTGETAPFYYGDERFGLPKRPDLSFVALEKNLSGTTAS